MAAVTLTACVGTTTTPTTPPGEAPTTVPTTQAQPATITTTPFRGCNWYQQTGIRPAAETPPLVAAVLENDPQRLRTLLDSGGLVDQEDPHYATTPLLAAVAANCTSTARILLEAGADPNHTPSGAETPLTRAVNVDNPELVTLLLEKGGDPSEGGYDMPSAIHEAVGIPRLHLLAELLAHASDVNVGQLPELPLRTGEDVGLGGPLEFAADIGCLPCMGLLIDAGADVTATAIYRSVRSGHSDIAERLIEHATETGTITTEDRQLLADYAEAEGFTDLAERIREWLD